MTQPRIAQAVILSLFVVVSIAPRVTSAQVLKLAELNTEQIRALKKDKTIVLIPGVGRAEHTSARLFDTPPGRAYYLLLTS
jgi:hypothetical protein